ncbi:hypothetical protein [Aeromonas encheleia]|uniref:Uncharacterized protein n=1 Tax=Aeromonas encheleia TaxID=73010 RepID=A0AAE9SBL2_9GAMM|nr:hypothetical protein [Aeromonas encheleia]USV55837.1 hypothetical protein NHF51_10675 [Aeromonas encheleia]
MKTKQLSQREMDIESAAFQTIINLGGNWFGEYMTLTNFDEIYDLIYKNYISIQDYKEQRFWLKTSLFRLLNGKACHKGLSKNVILKLQQIKI